MNIFEFINAESEHPLVPNRVKSPVLACDIQVVSQGSKWNSVQILRSQSTKVFVQKSFFIRGGIALHCCSGLTVHQRETITVIYIAPPSAASLLPPIPLLWVVTEHQVGLPVLYSNSTSYPFYT